VYCVVFMEMRRACACIYRVVQDAKSYMIGAFGLTTQRRFRVNTPPKMDVCDAVLWGPFPAMSRAWPLPVT
jgi:hypothetical protein